MKIKRLLTTAATILGLGSLILAAPTDAFAQGKKKFLVYLSLSYSGNAWHDQSSNIVNALAATSPYNELVELRTVISGTDVQAQISAYESMIAAGADAIVSFPISATGLNRTIKRGCDKGVLFFMYDGTVTEPCAHNISFLSGGFGENTAQWIVNALGGKGKVFLSRGVAGNSVDDRHTNGAKAVFAKYPGIKIVAEYYSMWDDRTTQQETAKALAAHPDVDAIWSQAGEYGVIRALQAARPDKLIPVTGENSNGFRAALGNAEMQKKGLKGVSSGSPPAQAGYAFKLAMEVLQGKRKIETRNIEYPLPWVTADKIKVCSGEKFENGCNYFPANTVPDSFITEVLNPVLLPEISLNSVLTGKPTPGATIQLLPADAVKAAPNMPGINCQRCEPPKDLYVPTKVTVQSN